MPVSVLQPSPALRTTVTFSPSTPTFQIPSTPTTTMQNGASRPHDNPSVQEIKDRAKEQAQRIARGVAPLMLIRSARAQVEAAKLSEASGDPRAALSGFTKAASLLQTVMSSTEFETETKSKGVLFKEFNELIQGEGRDLKECMESIEIKLKEAEKSTGQENAPKSIADRMRALQEAGMAVDTPSKRISREVPFSPPMTPPVQSTRNENGLNNNRLAPSPSAQSGVLSPPLPTVPPPLTIFSTSSASPLSPTTQPPQHHAFVHPSTLGPPSPPSSTSSSPHLSSFNLSEFNQTFPSIDELDELGDLHLTGTSSGKGKLADEPPITTTAAKAFPILPIDPIPRPASTPLKPSFDAFANSRPASPSPVRSPLSPTVPRKPSNLSLKSTSPRPPILSSSPVSIPQPQPEVAHLPQSNTIEPRQLEEFMHAKGVKVLLLDVRTRAEFEKEHVNGDAVVCLEPSVLLRESVTSTTIQDSLTVAPRKESLLFSNRDKFDLVVFYDESSASYNSTFDALFRAIYELAFDKMLKRMPMLLLGGLRGWKAEVGRVASGSGRGAEVSVASAAAGGGVNGLGLAGANGVNGRPLGSVASDVGGRPRAGTDRNSVAPAPFVDGAALSYASGRPRSGTEGQSIASSSKVPSPQPVIASSQAPIPLKPSLGRLPSTPYVPTYASHMSTTTLNSPSSIQYPQFSRPSASGSGSPAITSSYSSGTYGVVSPPPQASINPSPSSRHRNDYIDQSQEALSGLNARASIDYPNLSSQHILRPPPAAASPGLERQDNRHYAHSFSTPHAQVQAGLGKLPPAVPTIQSEYPVTYWGDTQLADTGLKNLGNTCYMNSTIQCLSATVPFARFFTDGRWKSAVNMVNPLGSKGQLTKAFAAILHDLWHGEMPYLAPLQFRRSICQHASQFEGSDQHDSQEFLSFLLDGLHEDLNRVLHKSQLEMTPEREAELEKLPQQIASEQEWRIYRMRNDSIIVDFFQGQFRNKMECLTCHKTSTTYNSFMYLTLPVPTTRTSSKVTLNQCLDAFVKEEVMEKSDAWNCPNCKALRRATKQLSLSRLPPILLIHLKRFSFKGPLTDKIETFVDFPLKGLDLTNYMPPPLPPGVDKSQLNGSQHLSQDDPRLQIPPYRYELYGVTNHFGSLSSGHYTAFVASRGGWHYCDDSRVSPCDSKEVVGKPAYVLYYKRVKA